jgi:hypothetical protein
MSKKKVEWKETNTFLFAPKYEYSLAVRNRCMFFGCLGRNYRKMLNYASNFAHPSRICVIYVYGDIGKEETFKQHISKAGENTLILHLRDIQKDIETFLNVEQFLAKLKSIGMLKVLEEGRKKSKYSLAIVGRIYGNEPGDLWYAERNKIYRAVENGYDQNDSMYQKYLVESQLWEKERPEAIDRINNAALGKGYDAYGAYEGAVPGSPDTHDNALLRIIKGIYPYGIESDTSNEYAYKMAASNKIVRLTVDGEENAPAVQRLEVKLDETQCQLSFFPDFTVGASEAVRVLREWGIKQMQQRHCIKIADVWRIFERPPFGAYRCNWYLYLFAVMLRTYNSGQYCFAHAPGYYSKRIEPQDDFGNMVITASGVIFAQSPEQDHFMRLMYKMFDEDVPTDATTGRAITAARSWITDHIHYMPVAAIDGKWSDILRWREDDYWQESGYEIEYLPWLEANFDRFYTGIRNIDADTHIRLAEMYGATKAELYLKYSYVKGGAIGWLHDPEDTEKRIEKYMKTDVCRECGAPLVREGLKYHFGYDGEKFTLKDIIGLNKKLLGRYQNEHFCIRCLCEVMEQTETQLFEKVHEFKEAGCKLFE